MPGWVRHQLTIRVRGAVYCKGIAISQQLLVLGLPEQAYDVAGDECILLSRGERRWVVGVDVLQLLAEGLLLRRRVEWVNWVVRYRHRGLRTVLWVHFGELSCRSVILVEWVETTCTAPSLTRVVRNTRIHEVQVVLEHILIHCVHDDVWVELHRLVNLIRVLHRLRLAQLMYPITVNTRSGVIRRIVQESILILLKGALSHLNYIIRGEQPLRSKVGYQLQPRILRIFRRVAQYIKCHEVCCVCTAPQPRPNILNGLLFRHTGIGSHYQVLRIPEEGDLLIILEAFEMAGVAIIRVLGVVDTELAHLLLDLTHVGGRGGIGAAHHLFTVSHRVAKLPRRVAGLHQKQRLKVQLPA